MYKEGKAPYIPIFSPLLP